METTIKNLSQFARNGQLSPQQKAIAVNKNLGNDVIGKMQGTTRVLYDSLPLNASREFKFFENCQTRAFPFTNLNQNRLNVGECMVVERIYFSIIILDATTPAIVTDVVTIEEAALPGLYASEYSIFYDTQQVMKPTPLASIQSKFNHESLHVQNEVMTMDNLPVIVTNMQWRIEVDTPQYAALANAHLRCTIEGFGTIMSSQSQY